MSIEVHEARLKDIPFVRNLAVEMVVRGIPHTRDVAPEYVRMRTRQNLTELEVETQLEKDFKVLVAEDTAKGQLAGYIMLDLRDEESSTGEKQCAIQDLAVRREYWGRFVVHRLMQAAQELAAERGLKYLVGEISVANERTLGTALKAFGFEIERHQVVLKVPKK